MGALIGGVTVAGLISWESERPITGIALETSPIQKGELFVAIPGFKRDGREFVRQAIENGAAAIAAEAPVPDAAVARVEVARARTALADLAATFFGHPSRELCLVGVTGTDGKTSTLQLLSAVLEEAGLRTGWLTTVDLKVGGERRPTSFQHTTPEATGVQSFLRRLADAAVDVGLLEISSHALALDRVRGCEIDVAIFTNLSPEHLNFHGSFESYLLAKAELFRLLDRPRTKSGARPES